MYQKIFMNAVTKTLNMMLIIYQTNDYSLLQINSGVESNRFKQTLNRA